MISKQSWTVIDEREFSELVSKTYGRPYRLQQQGEGIGNGNVVHVEVPSEPSGFLGTNDNGDPLPDFQTWLDRDETASVPDPTTEMLKKHNEDNKHKPDFEKILIPEDKQSLPGGLTHQLWWTRDFYPPLESVLTDLHAKGLLDAGDYTIHAWW